MADLLLCDEGQPEQLIQKVKDQITALAIGVDRYTVRHRIHEPLNTDGVKIIGLYGHVVVNFVFDEDRERYIKRFCVSYGQK